MSKNIGFHVLLIMITLPLLSISISYLYRYSLMINSEIVAVESRHYYRFMFSCTGILQTNFFLSPPFMLIFYTYYHFFPLSLPCVNLPPPEVTRIVHSTICRMLISRLMKGVIFCYQYGYPPPTATTTRQLF